MALSDPYATAEEYRAAISPDKDEAQDDQITEDLTAISRYIDGKCGQYFGKDAAPVLLTLDYDWRWSADPSTGLWMRSDNTRPALPPFVSVASVTFEGYSPILAADIELLPLDAPLMPEPHPYTAIGRLNRTGWYNGRAVLSIVRGWPEVPAAIKRGTIQMAALLRLESPRATRRIPEMGETIETSPSASAILWRIVDSYKVWWIA